MLKTPAGSTSFNFWLLQSSNFCLGWDWGFYDPQDPPWLRQWKYHFYTSFQFGFCRTSPRRATQASNKTHYDRRTPPQPSRSRSAAPPPSPMTGMHALSERARWRHGHWPAWSLYLPVSQSSFGLRTMDRYRQQRTCGFCSTARPLGALLSDTSLYSHASAADNEELDHATLWVSEASLFPAV